MYYYATHFDSGENMKSKTNRMFDENGLLKTDDKKNAEENI